MITTPRLLLRPWCEADYAPYAALNADPQVRAYFPSVLTKEESDKEAKKKHHFVDENGWGLWAVEIPFSAPFIGFIGLQPVTFEAHFTPAIEIGWRLAPAYWGKGYATEGALAVLTYAFDTLALPEIVSFTTIGNLRSIAVMQKIGMKLKEEFDHPLLPEGHPLRRHVLYSKRRSL